MAEPRHDEEQVHAHVTSVRFYAGIFVALVVLTGLTFAVSLVHLGALNLAIAALIATAKAALVVLFFMHLRWGQKFNALIFLSALLFGGIFLAYTLNDTAHRGEGDPMHGARFDERTGEWAPGSPPGVGRPIEARPRTE